MRQTRFYGVAQRTAFYALLELGLVDGRATDAAPRARNTCVLRKRDPGHSFWAWVPEVRREVPTALQELGRDRQVVIGADDAARARDYLRGLVSMDDAGALPMPVDVVDGDGPAMPARRWRRAA